MQSAALPQARNHGQSHKHNLLASITLSTVLLCFSLPNAYSVVTPGASPADAALAPSPAASHLTLSGNFIAAQVGIKYSVPLVATGGTAPYTFTISWGQLPAGLVLGASSGIISGTPSATGTSNFGIHVTDSKSSGGSQKFLITVSAAVAVTVTPATATVASGGTVAFTAAVSNTTNTAVTWSATTGTISTAGLYRAPTVKANSTATVTATSTADPTKSASASVTVTAVPLTLSGNFIAAQVGLKYSVALVAGGGAAPYTFAISSGQLPGELSLGTTSGIVSGTPTTTGTFNFGVNVTDSKSVSGSQTFRITVSPAVVVTVSPATATVQSAGTVSFTATVTNASNLTVTWSATTGTVSSTGLYQAPTVNANSTATVTATSAADATKSASSSVTITAIPLTLSGNFVAAEVGSSYSVPLIVGGGTAPYTFAISSGQLPAGLALGTSGTVSGTPSATGTFNFGINVTDSKSVAGSQTFQITVSPAVVVTVTPATATVESAKTVSFTAAVTNAWNQSVTWSATTGSISASGLYQAPTVNANSTATVTATSVAESTRSASASVTITAIPLTLSGSFVSAVVGTSYNVTLAVGGGTAPYTFAISSGQLPAGLALSATTGTVSGTPTTTGTFNFGVNVTDSKSVSGSQSFQVTVSAAVAVTVTPAMATVQSAGTVAFIALVSNTPNTAVNWSATMGTISTTGLYQASTVNADSTATVTVTSAADSTKSASALVTITAIPPPPLVIATTSLSAATTGKAYTNALSATGGKAPYSWSLASGNLPGGISVQSAGLLSGTTTQFGQFSPSPCRWQIPRRPR